MEELMPQQTLDFQQWLAELDRLSVEKYEYEEPISKATGADCWKDAYDEGFSPEDAMQEELSAGADLA
jgi:hypothetical protein